MLLVPGGWRIEGLPGTVREAGHAAGRSRGGLRQGQVLGPEAQAPEGLAGFSRLDGKEDELRCFLKLGVTKTAIAKITGVSRPTLYSFISTRGLRTNA